MIGTLYCSNVASDSGFAAPWLTSAALFVHEASRKELTIFEVTGIEVNNSRMVKGAKSPRITPGRCVGNAVVPFDTTVFLTSMRARCTWPVTKALNCSDLTNSSPAVISGADTPRFCIFCESSVTADSNSDDSCLTSARISSCALPFRATWPSYFSIAEFNCALNFVSTDLMPSSTALIIRSLMIDS